MGFLPILDIRMLCLTAEIVRTLISGTGAHSSVSPTGCHLPYLREGIGTVRLRH